VPSLRKKQRHSPFVLQYEAVEAGLDIEAAAAREDHEARSLASFRHNTKSIKTLRQAQQWLFEQHMAYATQRLFKDWRPKLDVETLKSY